jgi:hypothetical protein
VVSVESFLVSCCSCGSEFVIANSSVLKSIIEKWEQCYGTCDFISICVNLNIIYVLGVFVDSENDLY